MAYRLPAAAPFRYHCSASASSRTTPLPVAYTLPSRYMTCALPPYPSRRSVCRKSASSALARHTSSVAAPPGAMDATRRMRSLTPAIALSFKATMMSPKRMPDWLSGLPATVSRTSAPLALSRPSEVASAGLERIHPDAEPALLVSTGWLPTFTGSLTRRPWDFAVSLGGGA